MGGTTEPHDGVEGDVGPGVGGDRGDSLLQVPLLISMVGGTAMLRPGMPIGLVCFPFCWNKGHVNKDEGEGIRIKSRNGVFHLEKC